MSILRKTIFGKKYNTTPVNPAHLIIGGVASTIPTKTALATRLNVLESNISYFNINGNDVEAKIDVNYSIPVDCFRDDLNITFYKELNTGKCTNTGQTAFFGALNFTHAEFIGDCVIDVSCFLDTGIKRAIFHGAKTISSFHPFGENPMELIYLPEATTHAGTELNHFGNAENVFIPKMNPVGLGQANNGAFSVSKNFIRVWANPVCQTSNGGAMEGDLAFVRDNLYPTIDFSLTTPDFFTPPNGISTANIGNVYATAIQLIDPGNNANPVKKFTNITINGVPHPDIIPGAILKGLTASTSYSIIATVVDKINNESTVANTVVQSTVASELYPVGKIVDLFRFNNDPFPMFRSITVNPINVSFADGLVGRQAVLASGYIQLTNDFMANKDEFSVTMITKLDATSPEQRVLALNAFGFPYTSIRYNSGAPNRIVVDVWSPSSRIKTITGFDLTQYQIITIAVKKNDGFDFYVGDVLSATDPNVGEYGNPSGVGNNIGANRGGVTRTTGAIDEVIFWNKKVNQNEVTNIVAKLASGQSLI